MYQGKKGQLHILMDEVSLSPCKGYLEITGSLGLYSPFSSRNLHVLKSFCKEDLREPQEGSVIAPLEASPATEMGLHQEPAEKLQICAKLRGRGKTAALVHVSKLLFWCDQSAGTKHF